jgi:hypothetical protein
MIHPETELRFVNPSIGYGVFATAFIPKGTLTYVKDMLEIEVTPERFAALDPRCREAVTKYCYIDERGTRVVSWDLAKYVNHRCDCNTISTGYGFEIAIRDIRAGEEITDEYGLFNFEEEVKLACGCGSCRGYLRPSDADIYARTWDECAAGALRQVLDVAQPLWELVDPQTRQAVLDYLEGQAPLRSVRGLKWNRGREPRPRAA